MTGDVTSSLIASINSGLLGLIGFLQSFIAGLIVLVIGVIIAALVRQLLLELLKALRIEGFLKRYGVPEAHGELKWSNILSEIARWFVILLFLVRKVHLICFHIGSNLTRHIIARVSAFQAIMLFVCLLF